MFTSNINWWWAINCSSYDEILFLNVKDGQHNFWTYDLFLTKNIQFVLGIRNTTVLRMLVQDITDFCSSLFLFLKITNIRKKPLKTQNSYVQILHGLTSSLGTSLPLLVKVCGNTFYKRDAPLDMRMYQEDQNQILVQGWYCREYHYPNLFFSDIHHSPLSHSENKKYLNCVCIAVPVLVAVNEAIFHWS